MHPEDTERLERWKKETLCGITAELAAKSEALRSQPIEVFNLVVGFYGRKASAGFRQVFGFTTGVEEVHAMSAELKDAYAVFIVSALNTALAVDYPFLVALVFSDKDVDHQLRMCVVRREAIPGFHERISHGIVPIIRIKNTALGEKPKISFEHVDAEYLNSDDNLENIYQL